MIRVYSNIRVRLHINLWDLLNHQSKDMRGNIAVTESLITQALLYVCVKYLNAIERVLIVLIQLDKMVDSVSVVLQNAIQVS